MDSRRKFGLCTLCLGKEHNLKNAFEESEIGFRPKMVIEDLLHLKVCNRGPIPWMICDSCLRKLNAFRIFKCEAMKCVNVLRNMLSDSDSEDDDLQTVFDDAGEQNSSKENDSEVLKQEEDEVTEFHRSDSEISDKMEEVTISESEETSFPSNIEDCSEDTPEYLQNYASVSEVGDGCSEGDTCIGVSCDDDEDDELHLYLESDSESEVGGRGEEDESSRCQNDGPRSEKECSRIEGGEISSLEERNSKEAAIQCGGDNSVAAVGKDSPGKCVRRSLRVKRIRSQSEVVGSVDPEVGHKDMAEAPATCETALCTTRSSKERRIASRKMKQQTISSYDGAHEKRIVSAKEDQNASLLEPGGSEEKDVEPRRRKGMKKIPEAVKMNERMYEEMREKQKEKQRKCCREYYAKLSEEKKKDNNIKIVARRKERLAQMNEEERKRFLENQRDCYRRRKASMTVEEKERFNRQVRENRKKRLAKMSVEEKKEINRCHYEKEKRRVASLSEEEREEHRRRRSKIHLKWIASLSDTKRAAFLAKQRENRHKCRAALRQNKASPSTVKSNSL